MGTNKDVKVTITVGAKDLASDKINESVQAVHALSNATGVAGKQIYKLNGGLMSFENALKILAHLNNTIGLSSSQVDIFARTIGMSKNEVNDFLKANSGLTLDFKNQCNEINALHEKQLELSNKRKEDENRLNSLRKQYQGFGGDISNVANEVKKYSDVLKQLDKIKSDRASLKSKQDEVFSNSAGSDTLKKINTQRDKLNELTNKKNELVKNRDSAEAFLEINKKASSSEIAYASSEIVNLTSSIATVDDEINKLKISIGELGIKLGESLTQEEAKRISELGSEISKLNTQYEQLNQTIPKNASNISNVGEEILKLESTHEKDEEAASKLDDRIQEVTNSISEQSDAVNTADGVLNDYVDSVHGSDNANEELNDSANNLSDSLLDVAIKYKIGTKILEVGKKIYGEYCETLKKVGKAVIDAGESIVKGFGYAVDTVSELLDITENALSKFKELADIGKELQADWFKLYNYLGEQGGSKYTSYLNELHDVLSVDTDDIVGNLEGLLSMVDNLNLSLDKSGEAMEAFTNFGLDLATFSGESFGDIITQLENAVNLNVLNSRSALAHALNLTYEDVEVFKALNNAQERANYILSRGEEFRGNYQKWLETAGGKVSQMNSAVTSLTGNIQKLSTGLLAKFAPAITAIIKLLDRLVSLLSNAFGIDLTSAAANMSEGFDGIVGGAESASNALENTTETAKKLERQVAGFDDVIQINDSTDNETDINDTLENLNSVADIDFSSWLNDLVPEPSELEKKLDELYKIIEEGNWSQAGTYIRDMIVDSLNGIDWDSISNKVTDFSSGLANLLTGLLSGGTLGESIGNTIANLINTIVDGLNAFFVNKALFENLGLTIAKGIKSLFENLDTDDISTLLYYFVRDIFTTFSTFLDTMEKDGTWSLIGTKISDIINGFFSNFTVEDIENAANDVIRFIDGVFEMIGAFIKNLDTEDIKTKVTAFVRKLFDGFKEHQDEWASTLKEFTSFIVDMINTLIAEWDSSGMTAAIIKFLDDSGIFDMVWSFVSIKLRVSFGKHLIEAYGFIKKLIEPFTMFCNVLLGISIALGFKLAELVSEFVDMWQSGAEDIKNFFVGVVDMWKSGADDIKNFFVDFVDMWKSGAEDIKNFFADVVDTLNSGVDDFVDMWKSGAEDIKNFFVGVAENIKNFFVDFVDMWKSGADDIKNFFVGVAEDIKNFFVDFVDMWKSGADDIKNFFVGVAEDIKNFFVGVAETVSSVVSGIADGVEDFVAMWKSGAEDIKNFFVDVADTVSSVVSGIIDGIGGLFDWLWEKVTGIISGIGDTISSLWDSITSIPDTIGSMFSGVENSLGFNIDIPFLANGGIVQRASLAMVGEAGKEAVIPLENNTGWMDQMAKSLVNAMDNRNGGISGSGSTIVIDMSQCTKQVYTRSEMQAFGKLVADALNTYGANVSYNY